MATTIPMTADEFLLMPDGDKRHELIRGEVRSTSLAGGEHGRTVTVYAPDRTARVLGNDDTLDGGDVVPGFRLSIQSIFA